MVTNQIGNMQIINSLTNDAMNMLLNKNMIDEQERTSPFDFEVGYVFSYENNEVEALYKITTCKRTFYFVLLNNSIVNVPYTEEKYQSVVNDMKSKHPELTVIPENLETQIQMDRKNRNNNFIQSKGIVTCPLRCRYDANASLKPLDELCRRVIGCIIVIQESIDLRNHNLSTKGNYLMLLDKYKVIDALNPKELRIMNSQPIYTEQDIIDMDWAYEACWALFWVLGLVNDISDASGICDCDYSIKLIMDPANNPDKVGLFKKKTAFETFRDRCHLRPINEILDMEDLYFRYHWAIHEHQLRPETPIGNLNSSVVMERRRALSWVLTNLEDWYDVDLST